MPYTPTTWVANVTPVTAAAMNNIETGIAAADVVPCCRVYHNTTQAVANATITTIVFNSERFDTDSIHDPVTNNSRLTCRTAGIYQITAEIAFPSNPGANVQLYLILNGAITIANPVYVGSGQDMRGIQVTTLWQLVANDYVEVKVYQSGGAMTFAASSGNAPEFMMGRISA